ncbi:MAG: phosphatase PAP2 family protein [Aeromicrobium sp.]
MSHFNDRLYLAMNDFARHTVWLHGPARVFAKYGVVLFALAILAACWHWRRSPRLLAASVWAGLGTLIAEGINQPLGRVFDVARPYVAHPHALVIVNRTSDFSFPSDHAVMAGAVATGLLIVSRRWGLYAVGAAAIMAATRVYVGAHYPADVVAGLAVGALITGLGWLLFGHVLTRLATIATARTGSALGLSRADRRANVPGTRGWQD